MTFFVAFLAIDEARLGRCVDESMQKDSFEDLEKFGTMPADFSTSRRGAGIERPFQPPGRLSAIEAGAVEESKESEPPQDPFSDVRDSSQKTIVEAFVDWYVTVLASKTCTVLVLLFFTGFTMFSGWACLKLENVSEPDIKKRFLLHLIF